MPNVAMEKSVVDERSPLTGTMSVLARARELEAEVFAVRGMPDVAVGSSVTDARRTVDGNKVNVGCERVSASCGPGSIGGRAR